jgi:hypothetical protein
MTMTQSQRVHYDYDGKPLFTMPRPTGNCLNDWLALQEMLQHREIDDQEDLEIRIAEYGRRTSFGTTAPRCRCMVSPARRWSTESASLR